MTLVKRPFSESFTFSRPSAANHRDASGAVVTAAVNQPRFDHEADGEPRGLLVEAGAGPGQSDYVVSAQGWDAGALKAMVLHEYELDGEVRRVAFYTLTARATVDNCLNAAVHHREIKALDGWLRNRGGYVRHDGRNWQLGMLVAVQPGPLASPVLEDSADRLLVEG